MAGEPAARLDVTRSQAAWGRDDRETHMDTLLKGGVLWLLGVPVIGIAAAWMFNWI
jgi:hypothetical protein